MFCILLDRLSYKELTDYNSNSLIWHFGNTKSFSFKESDLAMIYVIKNDCSLINLYSLSKCSTRHTIFSTKELNTFIFQGFLINTINLSLTKLIRQGEKKKKENLKYLKKYSSFTSAIHHFFPNVFEFSEEDSNFILEYMYGVDVAPMSIRLNSQILSGQEVKRFEMEPTIIIPKEIEIAKIKRLFIKKELSERWMYIIRIKDIILNNRIFWKVCFIEKEIEKRKLIDTSFSPFVVEIFFCITITDEEKIREHIKKLNEDFANPYQEYGGDKEWVLMSEDEIKTHIIYFLH